MAHKVLLYVSQLSPASRAAGVELATWLKKKGCEVLDISAEEGALSPSVVQKVTLGIALGGDGTFLRLVRQLERKDEFPILGVNLGTLGFITETSPEEMHRVLEGILKGEHSEKRRQLLEVELWRGDKRAESAVVFNDAVVTKESRATLMRFEVRVDGELLSETGSDGFILSTPTGSTGYGISAGGPILHPDVKGILCIPICSHSLSARPVMVPENVVVELKMEADTNRGFLVCDGQINFEIGGGDRILVRTSKSCLRLIAGGRKWTETIRTKLGMV